MGVGSPSFGIKQQLRSVDPRSTDARLKTTSGPLDQLIQGHRALLSHQRLKIEPAEGQKDAHAPMT